MSSLDESIFGRIAVLNNYLRRDQLEECLRIQHSESPPRRIGDILLEKGYLTGEQLRTILEVRRKKARKLLRKPDEAAVNNKVFGALAVQSGMISLTDVEDAILEQERLLQLNLHFCLGEILVAREKITAEQAMDIIARQGKRILLCPVCDSHFNVVRFREDRRYQCPECRADLIQPRFLDSIAVDAVIED